MRRKIITIVLCCGDPRFLKDHIKFVEEVLKLKKGEYLILFVLGGGSVWAHPDIFEHDAGSVISQMTDYLDKHGVAQYRFVAVNHQDCQRTGLSIADSKAELREVEPNLDIHVPRKYKRLGRVGLWIGVFKKPGNWRAGLRFKSIAPPPAREKPAFASAASE